MTGDGIGRWLDARVRAAREAGAFDNLPGHGKPLEPDLLSGLTPDQRFDALLLRSFGEALPEATLLREIREGRARLGRCESAAEREALVRVLRAKAAEVSRIWRQPK